MEFNEVQFRGYHNPHRNEGYVEAHANGEDIGSLTYSAMGAARPSITDLQVYEPEHRRKGIATAMYNHAMQQTGGQLQHGAERTDAGEAFAQKTGGTIPNRVPVEDM